MTVLLQMAPNLRRALIRNVDCFYGGHRTEFPHCDVLHWNVRILHDGYRSVCITPRADQPGVPRIIPFGQLCGLTVTISSESGLRYGLTTHIPLLTLAEI